MDEAGGRPRVLPKEEGEDCCGARATGKAGNQLLHGLLGVWGPPVVVESNDRGTLAVGLVVGVFWGSIAVTTHACGLICVLCMKPIERITCRVSSRRPP